MKVLSTHSSNSMTEGDSSLIALVVEETVKLNETSGSFEDAFRKAKKKFGVE